VRVALWNDAARMEQATAKAGGHGRPPMRAVLLVGRPDAILELPAASASLAPGMVA